MAKRGLYYGLVNSQEKDDGEKENIYTDVTYINDDSIWKIGIFGCFCLDPLSTSLMLLKLVTTTFHSIHDPVIPKF